jgi:predicted alpha/beta hydrolase
MIEKEITYSDNTKNKVSVFSSKTESNVTIICLPAMGVRATFYKHFAKELNSKGYNVITADWRGQGKSSIRASRKMNFGYKEFISDIKQLIEYSEIWFPNSKKLIVGHSLGGQVGSLFTSRFTEYIDGLILIASCSVYYKGWNKRTSLKLFFAGKVFYPISRIFGYFPGNIIGFGGKEAQFVMKDWCFNTISGKYQITNSNFDYEKSLSELYKNILTISIDNDYLASKNAVENLYRKFNSKSNIEHLHLTEKETKIKPLNHFSWAKKPTYVSDIIEKWINGNVEKPVANNGYS